MVQKESRKHNFGVGIPDTVGFWMVYKAPEQRLAAKGATKGRERHADVRSEMFVEKRIYNVSIDCGV